MEEELLEDIRKARLLLKEFEESGSHSKKIRYFESGINILNNYLEDFPQSPHKKLIMNIRLSYTRILLNQLNKISPDMEEWVDYLLLFSKVKKEADQLKETNSDLKVKHEEFMRLFSNEEFVEEIRTMEKQISAMKQFKFKKLVKNNS